jgi:hypothetical protein
MGGSDCSERLSIWSGDSIALKRQNYQKIEGEDLAKALEKVKWIRVIKKVGDVEISGPVDDPM